jgi:hypothetical protein
MPLHLRHDCTCSIYRSASPQKTNTSFSPPSHTQLIWISEYWVKLETTHFVPTTEYYYMYISGSSAAWFWQHTTCLKRRDPPFSMHYCMCFNYFFYIFSFHSLKKKKKIFLFTTRYIRLTALISCDYTIDIKIHI